MIRRIADFILGYRHGQWDRGTFCFRSFNLGTCVVVRWQAEYRGLFYGDFVALDSPASAKDIAEAKQILLENAEAARAALASKP